MPKTIVGREPAVFWAMLATLLQAVSLGFGLPDTVQGLVNAVLVAAAGFATAAMVSVDAAFPAFAGLLKAVLALLLGFGIHVPDRWQVMVMATLTALSAFFVRTQVTARVGPVRAGGAHSPFVPGQ